MTLSSEFESLYHAMIYHVHHLIEEESHSWKSLSNALYDYAKTMEFELPETFEDALLDATHDSFFNIFFEQSTGFDSVLGELPYINYSHLEKHYLKWILDQKRVHVFLEEETIAKLRESLKDISTSIFDDRFIHVNQPYAPLDHVDRKHLHHIIDAIENGKGLQYSYMDDEGTRYNCDTLPLFIEYNMQTDLLYLYHHPTDSPVPIKGLLRRFDTIDIIEAPTSIQEVHKKLKYWRTPDVTLILNVSKQCPELRKVFVELSVLERTIVPQEDHYRIELPIFPHEELRIMAKVYALLPHVTLISPEAYRKKLHQTLSNALNVL